MLIEIDKLLDKTGSIYKLSLITALRAIELSEGAAKLVDISPEEKFANIALKEIMEGKVSYKKKEKK